MTLQQAAGAGLMLLFLTDIFLTVLYARAGTGLLAPYWNRATWTLLRTASRLAAKWRGTALSLAGPLIVVLLVVFWALGLTVGTALVIQPELGTAIRPSSGDSPTDFVTALMVAGNSLSIVGGGGYSPHTTETRLLFLANSLIGASVLSLVLSYLVQVYSALRERNALALTVDLMTDGTGDAAEMLAGLMAGGNISNATSELGNLVRSLAATKEAHHFYPLLFYFRFEQPLYAMSRLCSILLDLTELIITALDRREYQPLADSSSVKSLRRGALLLLATLECNFPTTTDQAPDVARASRYRHRFASATEILERAGIAVQLQGLECYVAGRSEWQQLADRVATTLGYGMDEIDHASPR